MLGQGSVHQYVLYTGKLWSGVDVDEREVTGGGIVRCVSIVEEVTGVIVRRGLPLVFTGTAPIVSSAFNVGLGPDSLGTATFEPDSVRGARNND